MLPAESKRSPWRDAFPFFTTFPDRIYFDSAATSLIPQAVTSTVDRFIAQFGGISPFRGQYQPAQAAKEVVDQAKQRVCTFFGAKPTELIFTQNTTQAINLVSLGWGQHNLSPGDKIVISASSHHSNLVPWQFLADQLQLEIVWLQFDAQTGQLDLAQLQQLIADPAVKLVSLEHISNVIGLISPLDQIGKLIKQQNALRAKKSLPRLYLLIDGAQAAAFHFSDFDHQAADFYTFSGHKMFGFSSIGGLLVKEEILKNGHFQPLFLGGGMVREVSYISTSFHKDLQQRFQAGTPDPIGVVSLAAATDFIEKINSSSSTQAPTTYLSQLTNYLLAQLADPSMAEILTPLFNFDLAKNLPLSHLVSFYSPRYNLADIAHFLDQQNFCVRFGQHCAQPLHQTIAHEQSLRLSFSIFNTAAEIDHFIQLLRQIPQVLHSA